MSRRAFIKNSLVGLPMVLLAPTLLASSRKTSDASKSSKSVLVIGAGISGLAAAHKLQAHGYTVTVLEAQDKVGGRTRTNRSLGVAFDEGASWIHGVKRNPIADLAAKAGMQTYHTQDEDRRSYDIGGVARSEQAYDLAEEQLDEILSTMMNHGSANQSFSNLFNRLHPEKSDDRLWKFLLSTYITFDTGDLDRLSSTLYDAGETFGGAEKIATNGYDTITNYLATGLNVQLNQRVRRIDYSEDHSNERVQVTHNGGVSEADYVVVTVPLGVLKNNTIAFVPELPVAKRDAIEKIGMNCVNKFLLTWDTAFWDDVQYISYTPEQADRFNYFVNVKKFHPSVNALMTFAYADQARQSEGMSDQEVIDAIMSHLKDIYGADIPAPTHLLRTRWQSNENSFGAYSYTAVGTEMQHFDDLAQDVNGRVFFAGEHTEADYFSTVHGAYLSGIREADKIIG